MPVPMVGRAAALDELRRPWARVRRTGRTVPAVVTGLPGGTSTVWTFRATRCGGWPQDPDVPRERYTPDALLRLAVTTVLRKTGASARTEAALKAVRTAAATG